MGIVPFTAVTLLKRFWLSLIAGIIVVAKVVTVAKVVAVTLDAKLSVALAALAVILALIFTAQSGNSFSSGYTMSPQVGKPIEMVIKLIKLDPIPAIAYKNIKIRFNYSERELNIVL